MTGSVVVALPVSPIWMTEHLSGGTKFITLIPGKGLVGNAE